MKTLKILVLLVLTSVTFYSCSDSNPIENETGTQKSIALRTVLNELKSANNITGRADAINEFCFEFVYPLTLSFNNGTIVTVSSFEGLIDVLLNESPALYVEGIEFPFQVTGNGTITTITNEDEFIALIESCGFDTFNNDLSNTFCFDIVFPITIQNQDGQVSPVNSLQDLLNIVNDPTSNGEIQIIFPISVIYNNETVVINSIYEFYEMTNNCDQGGCVCTQEYAPVCVQTANGILEFGNMCYAECAGYTQNDLVPCNPNSCTISNLEVTVGICNPSGTTFQLTINFTTSLPGATQFDVFNQMGVLVGTYNLSELPLTLDYVTSAAGSDSLSINLVGVTNCSASTTWLPPNCGCVCPTNSAPVCVQTANGIVQYNNSCLAECAGYTANDFVNCNPSTSNFSTQLGTCFQIAFPVTVQYNGQTATVNSNGELLQYWNGTDAIPNLVYPIVVTYINPAATFVFASQAEFQAQINTHCN